MQKLKVRAVADVLVQDISAMRSGVRRFIGRKLDPSQGAEWVDEETRQKMRQAVFVPMSEPDEVDDLPEHRKAVKLGDLEPADEATAKICGVAMPAQPKAKPASKE